LITSESDPDNSPDLGLKKLWIYAGFRTVGGIYKKAVDGFKSG